MSNPQPIPSGQPDLSGFQTFVQVNMGIPTNYLPLSSPSYQHALDQGINVANDILTNACSQDTSWSPYMLAVYNYAGHLLIEYAPDQSYPISAAQWVAGNVTITTTAPHGIMPGDKLTIYGVSPLAYSGNQTLGYVLCTAVPSATTFQYVLASNPGTANILTGAAATEQYFLQARKQLKINSFVPGVVGSSSDVSTSVGLDNPDFMKGLTLENLQLLKTAQGRAYLAIAQKFGTNVWGLT